MNPNAQESPLLWKTLLCISGETRKIHITLKSDLEERCSALREAESRGCPPRLRRQRMAPCFLKTWQEHQRVRVGTILLDAGPSTEALSCASPHYTLRVATAGDKEHISHLPFWPSISHWLSFSQRQHPSVLNLILCLVLRFNKRGRPGSLGLTREQWPTASREVRLLSDKCP